MKAPAFDYVRPTSVAEALGLLASANGEARVLAGGQSLLALMNLRVAAPDLLIDIARLPELTRAAEDAGQVTIGACVTHAMIEDGVVPDPSRGLMQHAAAALGYRAIRNRGTLGGSLALSDPAAEWPAILVALDAEAVLRGPDRQRAVKCCDFITGIYETTLAVGEIVEAVRIPKLSAQARWGYVKLSRKTGEFAAALAVVVRDPQRGYTRAVLGAANGAPLVLAQAGKTIDSRGDAASVRQAIAADLDAAADRNFDEYQRDLHIVAAGRAVQQAMRQ